MATLAVYLVGVSVVLLLSALLSTAGLGAAFLFLPFFYWLGVPLEVAMPTALLLNFVSLAFAFRLLQGRGAIDECCLLAEERFGRHRQALSTLLGMCRLICVGKSSCSSIAPWDSC